MQLFTQLLGGDNDGREQVDIDNSQMEDIAEICSLLSVRRRVIVVAELSAVADGAEVSMESMISRVACVEYGVDEPDEEQLTRAYTALYQSHLPVLQDAGAIRYDREEGVIARGPHFDLLEESLRALRREL